MKEIPHTDTEKKRSAETAERHNKFIIEEITCSSVSEMPGLAVPDSFSMLITTHGTVTVSYGRDRVVIAPRTVVRAVPENFITFEMPSIDFQAKLVSISKDMLNLTATGFSPNTYLYVRQNPIFTLTEDETEGILELFHLIKKKTESMRSATEEQVFHCLIMALYYELTGCINRQIEEKPQLVLSHKELLYKRFLTLLQENIRMEHSVTFYANQLCLTPQYISSVLKELSGMSTSKWIDGMLLAEAKTLLFSTENNIQQIANELNFPDQSSFGKFFKKMTGMSPANYKKQKTF